MTEVQALSFSNSKFAFTPPSTVAFESKKGLKFF